MVDIILKDDLCWDYINWLEDIGLRETSWLIFIGNLEPTKCLGRLIELSNEV